MHLSLLGTGDAAGMPRYGCDCAFCEQARLQPEHQRASTSAVLEVEGQRYLIDAGLMNIAERFPAGALAGIFVTHFHADHVQGLFHIRWGCGHTIPVYCPPDKEGCADLFKHPGLLNFVHPQELQAFELGALKVTPLPMIHSKVTFGYIFEANNQSIAYLTDTKGLPTNVVEHLSQCSLSHMIIDTSFPPEITNNNHNNVDDTLALHRMIKPKQTVLTHIGHDCHIWLAEQVNSLPPDVVAGLDGMLIAS